jgi:hypothetical protein
MIYGTKEKYGDWKSENVGEHCKPILLLTMIIIIKY